MRLAAILAAFSLAAAAPVPPSPLNVPFFHQQKNGCGAASLAMVAHYWKPSAAPKPNDIYDRLIDAKKKGIQLADMKRYFEEIGFQAYTLRGQWTDLEQHLAKGRPIIVSLRQGRAKGLHFAVLIGLDYEHVWLNDPTRKSASRAKRDSFEKQWSGADHWMLLATPRPAP